MIPISDAEYKMYVDLNLVYDTRLFDIAKKVINSIKLTPREQSVFEGKTKEINEYIIKIKNNEPNS